MKAKTRSIVVTVTVTACLLLAGLIWTTFRVVAWAADVPNRISVQIGDDTLNQTMSYLVTEGFREGLTQPDEPTQLDCLRGLSDMCDSDPNAIEWVRTEYEKELATLQQSDNQEISNAAQKLISASAPTQTPSDSNQ
jgi:hypothetical protein